MIFGDALNQSEGGFLPALRQSFLGTLVQSLHDITLDVKEYMSLGRALWPTYIEPLHSTKISKTLEVATKGQPETAATGDHTVVQREILFLLDRKFIPHIRGAMDKGVSTGLAPFDSNYAKRACSHDFPIVTKYTLLAAYLCQVNRPDRDRHLFSIQKNGRKRRGGNVQADAGEEVAFGSNANQHIKSLRPRSFPAERMLSVLVSMVGLHAPQHVRDDSDEMVRSLGSCAFFNSLAHLRDIGLLHEHPSRSAFDPVRMDDVRYCCSLTRDEAHAIAKSLDFPLDKYLL
jgi:hypothetical protein